MDTRAMAAMLRGGEDGEMIVPEERRLGCGMHIRAKFEKAAKGGDTRAAVALSYFKAIYRIEAACKEEALSMAARLTRVASPGRQSTTAWPTPIGIDQSVRRGRP